MKLNDQVVSLALSKKLKELNVKQESLFCYQPIKNSKDSVWPRKFNLDEFAHPSEDERIAAFTCAELGEMLPSTVNQYYWKYETNWHENCIQYKNDNCNIIAEINANTEADARAKMLIYLIENKLIKSDSFHSRDDRPLSHDLKSE